MKMRVAYCLAAVTIIALTAHVSAQSIAVTREDTPIRLLPEISRGPLHVAKKGEYLKVVRVEGNWVYVEFSDSQFSGRFGYVEGRLVDVVSLKNSAPVATAPTPDAKAPAVSPSPASLSVDARAELAARERPPAEALTTGRPSSVGGESRRSLTDQQVQDAIARGAKYKPLVLSETLNLSGSGYRIEVYSPIAWIQALAAKAKEELRPFTMRDVTDEMRADVWRVRAWPNTPLRINQTALASSVSHVVARTEKKEIVIQPLTKEPFPHSVQNAFGAALAYEGLTVTFPGDGMRELWGARQDKEFVIGVIGPNWKYDFTIKTKHFKQLQ